MFTATAMIKDFCSKIAIEPIESTINLFTSLCLVNALTMQVLVPHLSRVILMFLFIAPMPV